MDMAYHTGIPDGTKRIPNNEKLKALAFVLLVSAVKDVVTRASASLSAPSGDLVNQRSLEYAPIDGLARRLGGSSFYKRPPPLNHVVIKGYEDCSSPACFCPRNYDFVCGTDNHTYPNECILNCARECRVSPGVQVKHRGQCKEQPSNAVVDPGWGSEIASPAPVNSGPTSFCICIIFMDSDPVCGTDNKTYESVHLLTCAIQCQKIPRNTKVAYRGKCKMTAAPVFY